MLKSDARPAGSGIEHLRLLSFNHSESRSPLPWERGGGEWAMRKIQLFGNSEQLPQKETPTADAAGVLWVEVMLRDFKKRNGRPETKKKPAAVLWRRLPGHRVAIPFARG